MKANNRICFLFIGDCYESMVHTKASLEGSCKKLMVDLAFTMRDGLALYGKCNYALIALNISLCRENPFPIISTLRRTSRAYIVAIIPEQSNPHDVVSCYDHGTDFVLTERADLGIHAACFKSLYRRCTLWEHLDNTAHLAVMLFQDRLSINLGSREVYVDDVRVNLTAKEYSLLSYLARNADLVITIEQIVEAVWNHTDVYDGVVTSVMSRLRRKIEPDIRRPIFIHTIYGVGYKLSSIPIEVSDK